MIKAKRKTNSTRKKSLTSYVEIKDIIGKILYGEDLTSILDVILIHLERKLPNARALVSLYDEKIDCLITGSAPSLTEECVKKIHGLKIGPFAGSCGTAAFHRTTTVVRDITTDPHWSFLRDVAKEYNLRACWSIPILNVKGDLLGTFGLYYTKTHKPMQKETILVKELVDLACLAIDRDRSANLKKQSEEEIQIQRTNALNSLKHASFGEMAKNVSHEINSPLAVIQGSIHQLNRIIAKGDANPDNFSLYTARLNRAVAQIEKIIKGLHTITREASHDSFESVSAKSIIDEVLLIYQERFISDNIKLLISGDLEIYFECRSTQMIQVLVNLINNSYEAISKSKNPWIQIHVSDNGQNIKLVITDSGEGIPESIVEKIMIPLFTTKVLARATGLGLSVSQAHIQEHSGVIWYDKTCQNTRFVVELPKVQNLNVKQAA
jgi:signal transduction histidine kinase